MPALAMLLSAIALAGIGLHAQGGADRAQAQPFNAPIAFGYYDNDLSLSFTLKMYSNPETTGSAVRRIERTGLKDLDQSTTAATDVSRRWGNTNETGSVDLQIQKFSDFWAATITFSTAERSPMPSAILEHLISTAAKSELKGSTSLALEFLLKDNTNGACHAKRNLTIDIRDGGLLANSITTFCDSGNATAGR